MPTPLRAMTHFDEPNNAASVMFFGDISTTEDVNYLLAVFSVFHSTGVRTVHYDTFRKGVWNAAGQQALERCIQRIKAHGGCVEQRELGMGGAPSS